MECVGGEGLFGFVISMAANLIMSYVAVGESYKKGNVVDGKIYIDNIFLYFDQLGQEPLLIMAVLCTMLSIGSFNVFGVIVT